MAAKATFGVEEIRRYVAADVAYARYNAVRTLRPEDGRFEVLPFGTAHALRDLDRDDSYYNRVVGLDDTSIPALGNIVAAYHPYGRPCRVTVTPDRATPALLGSLAALGFRWSGGDCVWASRLADQPAARAIDPGPFAIRRATSADLDVVFDLWDGPASDSASSEVRARRAEANLVAEFPIYLVHLEGVAVAMASTFMFGGLAWLGNANTRADYRRHGCQRALVQHRLADAQRLGCDWALTDAAFGATSHRNAERAGMRLAFITTELELALPAPR